ncbi:3-carboxy-cis,cis-mucoante lactonizing enzyme [Patellaria atrata CBS 101060]|uniref:3-carboxy-cis,cis-mucoante lactonizing enzyme n=1 Tax=Patellaria atrata CBS 101060 TaxID=1346257 RepID=A0A9P4SBJ5_9PEZI|nr:3-carboxy-cis,cis-mucoante lactonizing enzyme [Patellaria atrata CBS 101060]
MHSILPFLLSLPLSNAATLFVSHYSGTVNTVTFTPPASASTNGTLTLTQSLRTCGQQPAFLAFDSASRTLYCTDEWAYPQGSLTAIAAPAGGQLSEITKVNAVGGGLANGLYGGTNGSGFIAVAHYQTSTLSTFALPLTRSSTAQQTIKLTQSGPGPNPSRQDAPHPHATFPDLDNRFLLAPDLGGDVIRIYRVDGRGMLTECAGAKTAPGAGPRHGVWWVSPSGEKVLFVVNELGNSITGWRANTPMTGSTACLTLTSISTISAYPNGGAAPRGAKAAEVRVHGNNLVTSNRADKSFGGDDSMATFRILGDGRLEMTGFTSAYGSYPRTFDVSRDGAWVVIGDQTSSNLAVVERDVETGVLRRLVARLDVGTKGRPEAEDGLSSVLWDQ